MKKNIIVKAETVEAVVSLNWWIVSCVPHLSKALQSIESIIYEKNLGLVWVSAILRMDEDLTTFYSPNLEIYSSVVSGIYQLVIKFCWRLFSNKNLSKCDENVNFTITTKFIGQNLYEVIGGC